jgi:oligopeptide/dipeptide ABC transporter ATP-binding protein
MIMVTHDLPLVSQICQRAAVMYAGHITEVGTTTELYHRPLHPYTRMLFGATPDLLAQREVISIPGSPPRLDEEIVGCPFRPRCDSAIDACALAYPPTRTSEPGHSGACFVEAHA